jgi:tetratricopeptide (TPR) repeat protein
MKKFASLTFLTFSLVLIFVLSISVFTQTANPTTRKAGERMMHNDLKGALEILDKAIESKKDLFEAYKMRAFLRSMSGNIDGTLADLTSALELKPDAKLYQERARFRMFKRDSQGALKDYDSAIAAGLKTEEVYSGRGEVKSDAGDFDGALADYQTAIGINPNYVQAYNGLSFLFEKKGDIDGAIAHLQVFLDRYEQEINGKLPKIKGNTMPGEGVLIKREGLEKDGSQAFLRGGSGRVVIQGNSEEENQKQIDKLNFNDNLALAYAIIGRLYVKKGANDKALQNLDKGLLISKDDAYLRKSRGELRLTFGDVKGAIEDLTIAADSPNSAPDHDATKGIVLLLQNKDAAAQKEFDKYLQKFPNAGESLNKRIEIAKQKRLQQ